MSNSLVASRCPITEIQSYMAGLFPRHNFDEEDMHLITHIQNGFPGGYVFLGADHLPNLRSKIQHLVPTGLGIGNEMDTMLRISSMFTENIIFQGLTGRLVAIDEPAVVVRRLDSTGRQNSWWPKLIGGNGKGLRADALLTQTVKELTCASSTGIGREFSHIILRGVSKKNSDGKMVEKFDFGEPMRAKVLEAGTKVTFVSAAPTYFAFGRIFKYSRELLHSERRSVSMITKSEIDAAWTLCGMAERGTRLFPRLLGAPSNFGNADLDEVTSINPDANLGCPIMANLMSRDGATRSAILHRLLMTAAEIRQDVEERKGGGERQNYSTAVEYVKELIPDQFMQILKVKPDFYKGSKVTEAMLRPYVVFPGAVKLLITQATQELTSVQRNITTDESCVNFQKGSFAHGGTDKLVDSLDSQFARLSYAYVCNGDDNVIFVSNTDRTLIMKLELDARSFDNSQRMFVMEPVFKRVHEAIADIDEVSGALYWNMTFRARVNVAETYNIQSDMVFSGPPARSLSNAIITTIWIERFIRNFSAEFDLDEFDSVQNAIDKTNLSMALCFELEGPPCVAPYSTADDKPIRTFLTVYPMLFCGYVCKTVGEHVVPMVDLVRTASRLPYHSARYIKDKEKFRAAVVIRVASIAMQMGLPHPGYEDLFVMFRARAVKELKAIAKKFDHLEDLEEFDDPNIASLSAFSGVPPETEMSGLIRALLKDPQELWMGKAVVRSLNDVDDEVIPSMRERLFGKQPRGVHGVTRQFPRRTERRKKAVGRTPGLVPAPAKPKAQQRKQGSYEVAPKAQVATKKRRKRGKQRGGKQAIVPDMDDYQNGAGDYDD